MLFRAVFLGGQVAALIGILFALPPIIIYKVTKGQGLKLSFCLFLFYFIQGLYYLIHGTRHERVKRAVERF